MKWGSKYFLSIWIFMIFLTLCRHKTWIRLGSVRAAAALVFLQKFQPFSIVEEYEENLDWIFLAQNTFLVLKKATSNRTEAISAQVGCFCPQVACCHFQSTQDEKINSLHFGNWDLSMFCLTGKEKKLLSVLQVSRLRHNFQRQLEPWQPSS